jgi:cytoskeletal protein CcmA (bactofilin family)
MASSDFRTSSTPSIIGPELTIKGNLSTNGSVQIDGKVEGDIDSKSLTIGETAEVNGVVSASEVMVRGNMQGEIKSNTVQLSSNARITGDIVHESLAVEAGASIEGRLSRMNPQRSN